MIESMSDFLSFAVMIFFTAAALYIFYLMNFRVHEKNMKYLEERYYRYYLDSNSGFFDEDSNEPYYEEQ